MKKVLITGASGFVGGYLADHLLSFGKYEVYGTYTSEERLSHSPVIDKIRFLKARLENKEEVVSLLSKSKPDQVYHLVGQANVSASFTDPISTFHANIDSQINLLDVLREHDLLRTQVLIIGSAEEYGKLSSEDIPVKETVPLRPANPYAVSKIAQDYLSLQYYLSYKMPIIRVRPFNHIGPRQKTGFVTADFAKQIAEIEKGKQEPIINVGNLEAKRDFTDVRDMIRAYHLILEKGVPGEVYNIGSGVSHRIREVLDLLLAQSIVKIKKEEDPSKLRPSDVPEIRADTTKIRQTIDWSPKIPFEQTLQDILDYWRGVV